MTWLALLLAARPRELHPQFAWPPGLDLVASAVVQQGEGRGVTYSGATWRLRTEAAPAGLRIVTSEPLVTGSPRDPVPWIPASELVVDLRGEIVTIAGEPEDARRTREWWHRMVDAWRGASFARDVPIERTETRAHAFTAWVPAPVAVTSTWVGPCGRRCEEVRLALVPDPAATLATLRALAEDQAVDRATIRESLRLQVDPRTWIPREMVWHVEQDVAGPGFSGNRWTLSEISWTTGS